MFSEKQWKEPLCTFPGSPILLFAMRDMPSLISALIVPPGARSIYLHIFAQIWIYLHTFAYICIYLHISARICMSWRIFVICDMSCLISALKVLPSAILTPRTHLSCYYNYSIYLQGNQSREILHDNLRCLVYLYHMYLPLVFST